MIGRDTCVIPLQIGVEEPSQLADVLGAQHVLGGLYGTLSWVTGPGQIRNIGNTNFIKFGELDNRSSERVEQSRQAFDDARVTVAVPANIQQALWENFLFVVSFGGVGAVTRVPIGVLRSIPEARELLQRCMQEIHSVARAHQIPLTDDIVEKTLAFIDALPPDGTTSLQRDIVEGKPSELDAWNGARTISTENNGRQRLAPLPREPAIRET